MPTDRRPSVGPLTFAVVADLHFGLARARFQGDTAVAAARVNAALARSLRAVRTIRFPADGGVAAGQPVGVLAAVAVAGDIANRAEGGVQPGATSWEEFLNVFVAPLERAVPRIPVYVAAGNHDASNAVGFTPTLMPPTDTAPMSGLRVRMPGVRRDTLRPFDYRRDRIHFVVDLGGVQLMVLHIWPDSEERRWMEQELAMIPDSVPVLLLTHDPPVPDVKHFLPREGETGNEGFQSLLAERWAPLAERRGLPGMDGPEASGTYAAFLALLARHRNVRAYFHGHVNYTEFYDIRDDDRQVSVPAFRVDSPLKGRDSANDDARLSYLIVSVATDRQTMTVREYRWSAPAELRWGPRCTVPLRALQATGEAPRIRSCTANQQVPPG